MPYPWGPRGRDAFIPRLLGIEAEEDRPYAELWMGAHPRAPSEVALDGAAVSLRQWIARYPLETLGEEVAEAFSGTLPFLFKVLSAGEALSIQAHPNRAQAQALRARDPEHYLDDNHKLELAVALEGLRGLVGFKPFPDILETLERYPELAGFVGQEVVRMLGEAPHPSAARKRGAMRRLVSTLMRRSVACADELLRSLEELDRRLSATAGGLTEAEHVFLELRRKYPGPDAGLFCVFLLNLIHLERGQGIFIQAGTPHAYLGGNIVECMTNSDNVVRAGLTPKFKDVETLLDILTYETGPVPILAGRPDQKEVVYPTPTPEFRVSRWQMHAGEERRGTTGNRPEILLVVEGEVLIRWGAGPTRGQEPFRRGQSAFIPALLEEYTVASNGPAELFRVTVPLR